MERIRNFLKSISADDLRVWAGATIFGRGESYIRNVHGLSRSADGTLYAWVSGSDEYATSVRLNDQGVLDHSCICPFSGPCKHAVAVVLAAALYVKRNRKIPLLGRESKLLLALAKGSAADRETSGDRLDQDDEAPLSGKNQCLQEKKTERLAAILKKQSREALAARLLDLAGRYPEVERAILEEEQLASGRADRLVISLRKEIRELAAEPAWYDHWKGEGYAPDYSHVRDQMRALVRHGHADSVLQLGEELWTLGTEQVRQSHDQEAVGSQIDECITVAFSALPESSLAPPKQLLWIIERVLSDQFSLLRSVDVIIDKSGYKPEHWLEVAAFLEAGLEPVPGRVVDGAIDSYQRGDIVDMLSTAYRRSGHPGKVIALLESEVQVCQKYEALVDELVAAGERGKAREWCVLGFERLIESSPGIALHLQKRLQTLARDEARHDVVAAYCADDFFVTPSLKTYTELRVAAQLAAVWSSVRLGALRYLETGLLPTRKDGWPLPEPEVVRPKDWEGLRGVRYPLQGMLIDVAILEQRCDDVVALYEDLRKTERRRYETDKAVAVAVVGKHPELALDIWRMIADRLIGQAKPSAYEEAAIYLREMRSTYRRIGCPGDWDGLLVELRSTHKAKRRLLEILDSLSQGSLID